MTARRRARPYWSDSGAAIVEFTLVSLLLLTLFLSVLQLGLTLHVRNTLVASAAEGARYGANADRTPQDGAQRARELIGEALTPAFAGDVSAGTETIGGVPVVAVNVTAALPVVGFLPFAPKLDVSGHAFAETTAAP